MGKGSIGAFGKSAGNYNGQIKMKTSYKPQRRRRA